MSGRALVLVAVLVASAGCGSLVGGEPRETATLSPAPVPTNTPMAANSSDAKVAPGLSRSNVTDVVLLADRHVAALENSSYRWDERYTEHRHSGNETVTRSSSQTITVSSRANYRRESDFLMGRHSFQRRQLEGYEVYADGDVEYVSWRRQANDSRVVRRNPHPDASERYGLLPASGIRRYLAIDSATVSRIDVGTGNADHYLVTGSRERVPGVGPVSDYRARAIVREDGFVRRLNASFSTERDDLTLTVTYSFVYREIGTATVTPPSWIASAREKDDE